MVEDQYISWVFGHECLDMSDWTWVLGHEWLDMSVVLTIGPREDILIKDHQTGKVRAKRDPSYEWNNQAVRRAMINVENQIRRNNCLQ